MIILKPEKFWYILLAVNILCIHQATSSITSYIGSFFTFGRRQTTTTTTPLPLIETIASTPSTLQDELKLLPANVPFDNTIDSSDLSEQYVPIVYYMPAKDLHQQYSEDNEINKLDDSVITDLNRNSFSYYPWYNLMPNDLENSVSDTNEIHRLEDNKVEIIPKKEDNLPKELIDLAKKLGYKDPSKLPPISELREALDLETDQEAIDFILDLASTEFGLNLIKSYIVEDLPQNSLEKSDNNEENEIDNKISSTNNNRNADLIPSESNSIDFTNQIWQVNDNANQEFSILPLNHDSSSNKVIVRRQNEQEDLVPAQSNNRLQSTLKRARSNFEILRKIIMHPFGTGLFGTLRHWTGFFTRQPNLQNAVVPTIYGPTNNPEHQIEYIDSIAEGSEQKPQFLNPNDSTKPHYIQYPDGSIYMINPLLFDYYNRQVNQIKQILDKSDNERKIDTETNSPLVTNSNSDSSNNLQENTREMYTEEPNRKKEENISLEQKPAETIVNNEAPLYENSFRKNESDIDSSSIVLETNSNQEHKIIFNSPRILNEIEADMDENSLILTTLRSTEIPDEISTLELTKMTATTPTENNENNSIDYFEQLSDLETDEQEGQESRMHVVTIKPSEEEESEKLKLLDQNEFSATTENSDQQNVTDERTNNDSYMTVISNSQHSIDVKSNYQENHSAANTDEQKKTTILKPISNGAEWKPQRVWGTNSASTGRIYRANPLSIVVPKMIVPTLGKV